MVPPKNAFLSLRLPIFGASYYIFLGKEGRKEVLSSGSVLLCLHPLVLIWIRFIAESPVTIGQTTWVNGEQCLISDEHR